MTSEMSSTAKFGGYAVKQVAQKVNPNSENVNTVVTLGQSSGIRKPLAVRNLNIEGNVNSAANCNSLTKLPKQLSLNATSKKRESGKANKLDEGRFLENSSGKDSSSSARVIKVNLAQDKKECNNAGNGEILQENIQGTLETEVFTRSRLVTEDDKGSTPRGEEILLESDSDCFSEDEFMPRNKNKSVTVLSEDSSREPQKSSRKKQGVYFKETDISKATADAEEKSKNCPSYERVHDMMPSCSPYVVTKFEGIKNSDEKWEADVRANIFNREQAFEWLAEFEGLNSLDIRVMKTKAENSKRLVFKRTYRCHHNTIPRNRAVSSKIKTKERKNFVSKNTNCPAFVRITIKQKCMKWSSDMLLQKYPCVITIHHDHNHPINAADALRRRRPCAATKEKFIQLLKKGHSPLSAIECHKFDLRKEHGDNYYRVAADGSICPSNFWVYKLFKKLAIKQYGPQCGVEMIEALKKFCDDFNTEKGSICCKVEEVEGIHVTVAICTPLMRRVHQLLKSSAEMMFVDASGNMDFMNCRVFLLLTPSVAGGMPLGILITTSESEKVVHSALELWKTLLPENAFYGRGPSIGPKLIMTDDCKPERDALKLSFKDATLLLCLFHVLQAFWRYIWAREQNVPKDKRSELFYLFKDLVYAESCTIFQERLKEALDHEELNKYSKVKNHLINFIPRSAEWALFQRLNLLTRGNDTNNYCEANIRILKEKVMNRLRAFNLVQLLDFMLTRYDSYVESRIIDVVNNRALNPFKSRYFIPAEKLVDLECQKFEKYPNAYCVKNVTKGTIYFVLMDFEICSCEAGKCGRPCKHMCAVVQRFHLSSSVIHPLLQCHNPTMKRVLFQIAHGHTSVSDEWFKSVFDEVCEKPKEFESDQLGDFSNHVDPSKYPDNWFMNIFGEQTQPHESSAIENIMNEEAVDEPPVTSAEKDTNSNEEIPPDIINKSKIALKAIFENYIQNLMDDPQTFHEPLSVFIKQNELLSKSQSGLVSALHCFGKSSGSTALGFKKRTGREIPVQVTAVGRRTTYLGGTKRQFTGRPPNAMRQQDFSDHTYGGPPTKRKVDEPVWSSLPKKRMPATHRLERCIQLSQMIGSNHSRK